MVAFTVFFHAYPLFSAAFCGGDGAGCASNNGWEGDGGREGFGHCCLWYYGSIGHGLVFFGDIEGFCIGCHIDKVYLTKETSRRREKWYQQSGGGSL